MKRISISTAEDKAALRRRLRQARRAQVASLPPEVGALVFRSPPSPVRALVPPGAAIGLYCATRSEAPASAYARHFHEAGHPLALPRIDGTGAPMTFHLHTDPYGASDLEPGPRGILQPAASASISNPAVLFVPLVGFTADARRLGRGGGHYDRWLAAHPGTIAIGLAWDVQRVEDLPTQEHDMKLDAIITPTHFYGPF